MVRKLLKVFSPLMNLLKSHPNPLHIYLSVYSRETAGDQAQEDNLFHLLPVRFSVAIFTVTNT